MNWKIVELEVALIAAIVLTACYCNSESQNCIIYFFMLAMIITPVFCWLHQKWLLNLINQENRKKSYQSEVSKKQVIQLSQLIKVIDKLKNRIETLESENKKLNEQYKENTLPWKNS